MGDKQKPRSGRGGMPPGIRRKSNEIMHEHQLAGISNRGFEQSVSHAEATKPHWLFAGLGFAAWSVAVTLYSADPTRMLIALALGLIGFVLMVAPWAGVTLPEPNPRHYGKVRVIALAIIIVFIAIGAARVVAAYSHKNVAASTVSRPSGPASHSAVKFSGGNGGESNDNVFTDITSCGGGDTIQFNVAAAKGNRFSHVSRYNKCAPTPETNKHARRH